jgi:hypothetical protein
MLKHQSEQMMSMVTTMLSIVEGKSDKRKRLENTAVKMPEGFQGKDSPCVAAYPCLPAGPAQRGGRNLPDSKQLSEQSDPV